MKPFVVLPILVFMLGCQMAFPQGVAINNNGNPADPSAILDASSIDKGALLPRMTDAQRNAITNPADGLIIYNTTTKCLNIFKIGSWYEICGNCITPASAIAGNNSPVCSGDTIKLTASGIPNATYTWSGPNGFSSSVQNPKIPAAVAANSGTYSVTVTVGNCSSTPSTTVVTVNQTPSSAFTFNPSSPGINTNVTFSPSVSGATYNWSFQGGTPSTSSAQNPVVQWAATGTYSISLAVLQNGCLSGITTNNIIISVCGSVHGSQTFSYTGGTQNFTIPACIDTVTIQAYGAQGGSGGSKVGGLGAIMQGKFPVAAGQVLTVVVGGKGIDNSSTGSGGGGSGVHYNGTPLIIAGGGGGSDFQDTGGLGGTTGGCGLNGINGSAGTGGCGGANGTNNTGYANGRGGKGWNAGSNGSTGDAGNIAGTFGLGGGGGAAGYGVGNAGGGGGGYSGGGAGGTNHSAGGGGSYNTGSAQVNTSGTNSGDGKVIIVW